MIRTRRARKTAADYARDQRAHADKQILWITPPEGVPIRFVRATLGARILAQLLDFLFTYGTLLAVLFLALYLSTMSWDTLVALFAVLSFLLRIPYYILTELVWNGRTIGKRILKIRVMAMNGRRLDAHQIVVRNLLKEAEVFTPIMLIFGVIGSSGWLRLGMFAWLLIVLAVPLFSRHGQRLGDMIAGTAVVRLPRLAQTDELTEQAKPVADQFIFQPHHLEHYGQFELQSLEDILRDARKNRHGQQRDIDISKVIRRKIGFAERIADADARAFLSAFYNAQRAHLEARQIFGDRRADKFHRAKDKS